MAHKITLSAKLYVNDSDVLAGKKPTSTELETYANQACELSKRLGGIVELHIVMDDGNVSNRIDVFDALIPYVFNNGHMLHREEQG
jgi:hypothetical protein